MGLFSFGGSKSKSTQSSQSSSSQMGENFSQSGSQQGSSASSFGIDRSQSAQNIYGGQEPYLQSLYSNAENLLTNYGMPDRQVAGINPFLEQGLGQQFGFSQGVGQDIFATQLQQALANTANYGTAAGTANRMAGGNVYNAPTNRGIDLNTVAMAANNPYLNSQIDAASQDIVRNLGENQLTGNAAMAAGTGNSASSRRAVMDAIAQRGAADRIGAISASMRGDAYNQGLGIASQQALANQQARLGTNSLNANLMNSGANLAYNLGQQGQLGFNQAYTTGANNAAMATDAGNYLRQYQQQVLDTAFQNQMNPYNSLQMYQSFIGAPTVLASSNSMGLQGSNSSSFGNSFNNSYGYDTGTSQSSSKGTTKSGSLSFGF